MRTLIVIIIFSLWFSRGKIYRYFAKHQAIDLSQKEAKDDLIQPVLNALLICGELAAYQHSETQAGYWFFPLSKDYYKASMAEVSYADLRNKDPQEIAHQIIFDWNKNDEIALNPGSLKHSYIVKDGAVIPLLRSVRWFE